MSEISTLTIKIPVELKEQIKAAALEAEHSLSSEVCARLVASFTVVEEKKSRKHAKDDELLEIDSQHTSENTEPALTQKELKKLRTLLNTRKTATKKK